MVVRKSRLPGLVLAALLAATMPRGQAQQVPEDGRTCFCLRNSATRQFLHGCTGSRYGQDAYVTASCGGSGDDITVAPPWTFVLAGTGQCTPCNERHKHASSQGTRGPAPAPVPSARPSLQPVRTFLRARDIPQPGVGAYGIVAMRSMPTPANRERLTRFCTAFISHLPRQDKSDFPLSQQMVTIWPLDQPDAQPAKADDCGFLLDHYDLQGGLSAINDAEKQNAELPGQGPFLLGWSPSNTRGVPDKFVLFVDMSDIDSEARFDERFAFWQQKIIQDPALWRYGFSREQLRLAIAEFVDRYGPGILNAVKLFGGKG